MTNEELAMRATAVRRNIVKNVDESRIGDIPAALFP